jgi:hypothetical protein
LETVRSWHIGRFNTCRESLSLRKMSPQRTFFQWVLRGGQGRGPEERHPRSGSRQRARMVSEYSVSRLAR